MPAWRVRFHRLAADEYLRARRRYARQSERAADRFVLAVDVAAEKIANDPLQLPIYEEDIRWVRTRRFPFVLYFHIYDENTAVIFAVAHDKRRPGYWKRRKSKP